MGEAIDKKILIDMTDKKKRLYSLDLMKVVAVLMITNSHFVPLYKDVNTSFATLGVQGNALFFFVSGFLLMKGWERQRTMPFLDWCRNKYRRIIPSALVWSIVMAALLGGSLSVGKLLGAERYWFLQAILIYYVLEYVLLKLTAGFRGGYFGLNMVRSIVDNNSSRILPNAQS